ncbi:MAG: cohesin domain-containing protein [Methanosarcinaceae archaeon]
MSSKTMILFLIGMFCLCAASAQAAQVHVEPDFQTVLTGENFTVNITVYPEGSEEIFGIQYDLYFNNTLLNVTSQTKGSFLSHDGAITNVFVNKFNNTLGMTEYGETRTGVVYGVTIPGILATITFQAIAEVDGISEIRLDKIKISDPDSNPISANVTSGNVSVKIGICGDVNDDGDVNMDDVMTMWYNIANYPTPGAYTITNAWAADVNCDGDINMDDVMTLWYDIANYPTPGASEINCCC